MTKPIEEKRLNKRYLCDEYFTSATMTIGNAEVKVTAIDFNKEGMGIFTNAALPDEVKVLLAISYTHPEQAYEFEHIPCSMVYENQTEVGSQCGLKFLRQDLSEHDLSALSTIENILTEQDDPEDRYHLMDLMK